MADDTGTDWAAEAEWHERQACPAGLPWTGDDPSSDHGHTDCLHHHTAAVGLRRLAQLDTAIGDPGNLRLLADTFDLPILRRIADAAVVADGEPAFAPEGDT